MMQEEEEDDRQLCTSVDGAREKAIKGRITEDRGNGGKSSFLFAGGAQTCSSRRIRQYRSPPRQWAP